MREADRRVMYEAIGRAVYARIGRWARAQVQRELKAGRLKSLLDGETPCVDCGDPALVYEHRNYFKPLAVEPVCDPCNHRRGPIDVSPAEFARNICAQEERNAAIYENVSHFLVQAHLDHPNGRAGAVPQVQKRAETGPETGPEESVDTFRMIG